MAGVPLLNPRWERFCHAYVSGPTAGNATASYVAAGFAGEGTQTARSGASRLLCKDIIQTRIGEIQAAEARHAEQAMVKAAERLGLREEVIAGQWLKMGFANIFDYVRRDEKGELVVALGAIERDQAVGIVELIVDERGEGEKRRRIMRVRLGNRNAALVSLGKYIGMFADKPEQDALRKTSTEDLKRKLAELNRKRGVKEVPVDASTSTQEVLPPTKEEPEPSRE
jgi:hypothetical protein